MKSAFLARPTCALAISRAPLWQPIRARRRSGRERVEQRFTLQKFFFGFMSVKAFRAAKFDQNRANRLPSDSLARGHRPIFLWCRAAAAGRPRRPLRARRSRTRNTDPPDNECSEPESPQHTWRMGSEGSGPSIARAQTPSLRLSTSFTACGLALPPDAFITWPTNQPISFGLPRACATLSGFL